MRLRGILRWILAVAFLPFVVLGLLVLAVQLAARLRYDPSYFGQAYVERYSTPEAAVRALEQALQTNDEQLLAEVMGLRRTARFPTGHSLAFVRLWERTDRYRTYLYFDRETYERYLYPFEYVRGRWVVSPPDLYYTMRSGRWRGAFLPAALAWWVFGAAAIGTVWLCRRSVRFRGWVLGS
jgi:hypothetical protein